MNRSQLEIQKTIGKPAQASKSEDLQKIVELRLEGMDQRLAAMQMVFAHQSDFSACGLLTPAISSVKHILTSCRARCKRSNPYKSNKPLSSVQLLLYFPYCKAFHCISTLYEPASRNHYQSPYSLFSLPQITRDLHIWPQYPRRESGQIPLLPLPSERDAESQRWLPTCRQLLNICRFLQELLPRRLVPETIRAPLHALASYQLS